MRIWVVCQAKWGPRLSVNSETLWAGLFTKNGGYLACLRDWISSWDEIKRRFNGVLLRFTIWSILLEPGPALGVGLLGFRPPRTQLKSY